MTASRFASPRTICGDLPPSSSVTFLKSRAAWTAISRPTSGLPVKLSLSTPGWRTSAAPAVSPKPGTTLTTPAGKPTSSMSFAIHSVDRDASSAGLRTTALPAASAGPSFQDAMSAGAFQAEIAPTTPTGSRIVYAWRVIPKNGAGRHPAALDLVRPAREVPDDVDDMGQVDHLGLERGTTDVERLERGERVDVALDGVGEPVEQQPTVGGRASSPTRRRRPARARRRPRRRCPPRRPRRPSPGGPRTRAPRPRTSRRLRRRATFRR